MSFATPSTIGRSLWNLLGYDAVQKSLLSNCRQLRQKREDLALDLGILSFVYNASDRVLSNSDVALHEADTIGLTRLTSQLIFALQIVVGKEVDGVSKRSFDYLDSVDIAGLLFIAVIFSNSDSRYRDQAPECATVLRHPL